MELALIDEFNRLCNCLLCEENCRNRIFVTGFDVPLDRSINRDYAALFYDWFYDNLRKKHSDISLQKLCLDTVAYTILDSHNGMDKDVIYLDEDERVCNFNKFVEENVYFLPHSLKEQLKHFFDDVLLKATVSKHWKDFLHSFRFIQIDSEHGIEFYDEMM